MGRGIDILPLKEKIEWSRHFIHRPVKPGNSLLSMWASRACTELIGPWLGGLGGVSFDTTSSRNRLVGRLTGDQGWRDDKGPVASRCSRGALPDLDAPVGVVGCM